MKLTSSHTGRDTTSDNPVVVTPRVPLLLMALAVNAAVLLPILWSGFYMDDALVATTRGGMIQDGVGIWAFTFRWYKAWLHNQGRFSPFLHIGYPLLYVCTNPIPYKILIFVLTLSGVAGFYRFVQRMCGSGWTAFWASVLLPVCVQLRGSADPLLAFSALYPILSVLLFGSLLAFSGYLEKRGRRWPATVMFAVAALTYETVYPLVLLYVLVAFAYRKSWRSAFRAAAPMLVAVACLLVLGVYFRSQATDIRAGGAYSPNFQVASVAKAYLVQVCGTIPFIYSVTDPHSIFLSTPFSGMAKFWLLAAMAGLTGLGIWWARQSLTRAPGRQSPGLGVLPLIGAMLLLFPPAPISLSPKYQAMGFGDAYLQVFFSCFGLALLGAVAITKLESLSPRWTFWISLAVVSLACAMQWRSNYRVVDRLNNYYLEPREIAQHSIQRAFGPTLGAGSVILIDGDYFWLTDAFFTQWTGSVQKTHGASEEGNYLQEFRDSGASCVPHGPFEQCTFPPQAKVFYFRVQSFAPGQGTATLSRLRSARIAGAKIQGLSSEQAFLYFEPGHSLRMLQPSVHARYSGGADQGDTWFPFAAFAGIGGGPGWQHLRLDHDAFDPAALDALWTLPHLVDLPPIQEAAQESALDTNGPIHAVYGKTHWGPGIAVGDLKLPVPASVEVIVRPGAEQNPYSTILSNHGAAFTGLTIEQAGASTNSYSVALGSGAAYVQIGMLRLPPQQRAYISLQIGDGESRLYLNGNLVSSKAVKPVLSTPGIPVRVGNWLGADRQFRGDIEEIAISPGVHSPEEIRARAAKILDKPAAK